ncbi:MAG TPA: hypothetical protein VF516_33445 [Kofleriaceae bacterium]
MVIGGIAVIAHGVQRMTTDIDAVIQGDAVSVHTLIDVLQRHHIVPRIADAEAFAATNLVLLTRHQPTEVDLDLSFGWTVFEHEALAARSRMRYGEVAAPMAGVEELLVFKAMAGRPRDIEDAVTLLTLYPRIDLRSVRTRVATLAELAEAPELMLGFERIVRAAAMPTKHTSPAKPPARRVRPGVVERTTPRPARPRAASGLGKKRRRSPR